MHDKKIEICKTTKIDPEKVETVKDKIPTNSEIMELAETFKALADPTRLKIIYALADEELCVCDLAELNGISVSGISHQLRLLRSLKLVKYRKEGKIVYYSLDDDHVRELITKAYQHLHD